MRMDHATELGSLRAHLRLVLRRLERTSFRNGRERTLLAAELERALSTLPAPRGRRGRTPCTSEARLLREAAEAAARVEASLAQLRALEPDADGWRRTLDELEDRISTLLATEEDRLDVRAEGAQAGA